MDVVALVSLGVSGVQMLTGGYQAFHKTKLEELCERLLETNVDISPIYNNPETQGYFFSIIHKFIREANNAKIEQWKNALTHIITDFKDYDYKDNFLAMLEALTAFDLTVLSQIYLLNQDNQDDFLIKLFQLFGKRDVPEELVVHSVKRLASQGLVSELVVQTNGVLFGGGAQDLQPLRYAINNLGHEFLRFVSEYERNEI